MKLGFVSLFMLFGVMTFAQNSIELKARFDVPHKTVKIEQQISYQNTSNDTLTSIYLNDWNNAYATKNTPLAKRFAEEFSTKFHFAKNRERGYTNITAIVNNTHQSLEFTRLKEHPDIVKVSLTTPLKPGDYYQISLNYNLVLPDDSFTNYGKTPQNDFNLKYWYLTPVVFDGQWHYYSNKNLDDMFVPPTNMTLTVEYPKGYEFITELNQETHAAKDSTFVDTFKGLNRVNTFASLMKTSNFKTVKTDGLTILSNIEDENLPPHLQAIITNKVFTFIKNHLGAYPHERVLLTSLDYKKDPLYGLNQLPNFIRPFSGDFQYELKLLKTALNKHLDNTLIVNPRKDYWLKDGIQTYYLIKYIEENYPNTKMIGGLANIWGLRSFHAADLNYNEQYNLFYMQMARTNRDQSLTMSKDSLLKFNANIANKYKAGIGLKYLDDYINANILETSIKDFLNQKKLKYTSSQQFETYLKQQTPKDLNWFFTDFVSTRKKIDFKIKHVIKTEDSVTFTIKNKRHNNMPVSLFTLKDDSVISRTWISNINDTKTLTIPRKNANKLVLNYDNVLPEINLRDNWKSLRGFLFNNKPLQFRLFKDVEDPYYNQVFFMPIVEYRNIYDGLNLGAKMYNKTLLRKRLNYRFTPQYSTTSKTITGSSTISYTHNLENNNLYNITYGIGASYASFGPHAFVTKIMPSLSLSFRNDNDFRSNKLDYINARYLDITRAQKDPNIVLTEAPDYGVFNLRYLSSNNRLINYNKWFTDFQISKTFGKLAFNYEYRNLSTSNRQFNFRFFAGTFLYNKNAETNNYFSFALDRPTDYLFDYDYLGRSEASGIFSQQLIIAEGGFKSKLQTPFANQWMTTANLSTSIWKYIEAYGDVGLVKNKYNKAKFVYDSGIRLNLVPDYFELFFPIYSNLGWEIAQSNYSEKIRFVVTIDPKVLLELFRRRWY